MASAIGANRPWAERHHAGADRLMPAESTYLSAQRIASIPWHGRKMSRVSMPRNGGDDRSEILSLLSDPFLQLLQQGLGLRHFLGGQAAALRQP